jgi:hypothetical protein
MRKVGLSGEGLGGPPNELIWILPRQYPLLRVGRQYE